MKHIHEKGSNYITLRSNGWRNPCILEYLLANNYKTKLLIHTLESLHMRVVVRPNGWFDIVDAT